MALNDQSYSRLVAWLKVVLPLLALGLLSTLFLVSRSIDPSKLIPFADASVQELAREQGVRGPNYSGMSKNGSAITISAESARPNGVDGKDITATKLVVVVDAPDGDRISITAPTGKINNSDKLAELFGGISMKTSDGLTVETESVIAKLDLSELTALNTVTAVGSFGDFSAGSMVLTQQSKEGSEPGYVLLFTGGVKLLYAPKK